MDEELSSQDERKSSGHRDGRNEYDKSLEMHSTAALSSVKLAMCFYLITMRKKCAIKMTKTIRYVDNVN